MQLRDRLRNWARANKWYQQQGKAFSLEGRYRSKAYGQEVEYISGNGAPPPTPEPIDIWDAWELELAWRELTPRSHWVMKYDVHATAAGIKLPPEAACRLIRKHGKITLRSGAWTEYRRIARKELQDVLAARMVVNINVNKRSIACEMAVAA